MDALARFLQYVSIHPITGCWLWLGYVQGDGYGNFWLDGRNIVAHIAAYRLMRGDVPTGLFVLHTCDVRSCVNPDHLFLGTGQDNMDDMVAKGRSAHGETHGRTQFTDEQIIEMRSRYSNDKEQTQVELAEEFGVSVSTVHNLLTGKTWTHLPMKQPVRSVKPGSGNPHGNPKLAPGQVVEILTRRSERAVILAREYGVTSRTIRNIWNGDAWKPAQEGGVQVHARI